MSIWTRTLAALGVGFLLAVPPAQLDAQAAADKVAPIYQIHDITEGAQLDDKARQTFCGEMASLLKTRPGPNRVVTFIAATHGQCVAGPCRAHEVVMLEVDAQSRMVDGWFFVLEWSECPRTIWRLKPPGNTLRDGLTVDDLGFDFDPGRLKMYGAGILDNIYRGKQVLTSKGLKR